LYTSGSTGQPKGVIQNHRNGLHDITLWTKSFHICPDDRLTLLAFETGQAIKTIYSAVLNGAALYPRDIKVEGVANLATWLIQEEITMYFSGAALFRYFLDTLSGEENFPKLRLIRLSSEQVSKRDVEGYKKHFCCDCILINALSSNEVGTFREYWIDKESHIASSTVPVGYAVEDKELLLLDDAGQEVGYESIGEITVRSCYLSPGYWRRPDLTRDKFLPDPNGGDERTYLTGDLGRMAADGCLFHLGRQDFRVKVRGYAVEVSEIEMALLEHAAIKEAAVIGEEISSGDRRLVAYFVPNGQPSATVAELRNFLKDRLPDYMIPSAFVVLSALPLTPNGKVDRLGLPDPGGTRPKLDTLFVAPRTAIEEELAGIWAEVLSLDPVGIHDNFYELGGHSLAATRVVSRVLKRFQLELSLQSLFRSPTVAEMAVMITEHQGKKLDEKELQRILTELESRSEDDAHRLLSDQSKAANAED
jgi:acyl-coenzyme A synthetase/AMP-(fatty) acid ligase/acyl carrier protein